MSAPARDLAALPPRKSFRSVIDYKLANGLRVLLAPDQDSVGVDARLVISGAEGGVLEQLPGQAAYLLHDDSGAYENADANELMHWYMTTVHAPVSPRFAGGATVFEIAGGGTFADWHVWHLAWRVLHGRYPACDGNPFCRDEARKERDLPEASEVLARRLVGLADGAPITAYSRETLDAYRRATYRPEVSTLVVAGRFDPVAMRKEIDALYGSWRADAKQTAKASAPAPAKPTFVAVPADDAHTVSLEIGFAPAARVTHDERISRAVLVAMIEQRLRVVREGLGATYGVHATVEGGVVRILGDVEPAYAAKAAKAVADAIASVRAGGPGLADDFARAKATVLLRTLASPVGATSRANALERIAIDGLSPDVLDREPEEIRALDLATVQRVAARDLAPERQITVARGKRDGAHAALIGLGATPQTIETFSRSGRKPSPKADPVRLQTASAK